MNILEGVNSKVFIDPRQGLLYRNPSEYLIKKSASSIVCNFFSPDSLSNANVTWSTITPPSRSTIIDRAWWLQLEAVIDFVGDNGANNLLPLDARYPPAAAQLDSSFMGVRAYGFNNCINNTQLSINNVSVTNNTGQFVNVLPFTFTKQMRDVYNQVSVSDTYQQIGEYHKNNNNPLVNYGQSDYDQSRNGLEYIILSNTPTAASIRVRWYEPLILPALLYLNGSDQHGGGLIGVQNINLVLSLSGLTNLMELEGWGPDVAGYAGAVGGGLPPTGVPQISAANLTTCNLLLTFITPTIALPPVPLPQKYNYINYYTLISQQSNSQAVAPNPWPAAGQERAFTKLNLTSNNIQLSTYPSKILIYVGKSAQKSGNAPALPNYNYTDCNAVIDNISINFSNQSGLLASCSQYQLWAMSCKNGLRMSYEQFRYWCGSILILDCAADLPSDVLSAVGSSTSNNFQVTVQYHDANPPSIQNSNTLAVYNNPQLTNYSLYTIFLYDEVMTIDEHITTVTNSFDSINVLRDLASGKIDVSVLDYELMSNPTVLGTGSFLSMLKHGLQKVGQFIKSHPALDKFVVDSLGTIGSVIAPEFAPAIGVGVAGLNALIDKYTAKGYGHPEIVDILSSQYPRAMIESALVQASGGRRVASHRLRKRRY